jgi:hypothetical protein
VILNEGQETLYLCLIQNPARCWIICDPACDNLLTDMSYRRASDECVNIIGEMMIEYKFTVW